MTRTTTPDFAAVTRAIADSYNQIINDVRKLWRGPAGQIMRRRYAVLAARRAHKADGYRDYRFDPFPPSGCALCGLPARDHYQRWTRPVGWHKHVPPTAAHILARMRDRRAARLTRKATS